MSTPDPQGYYGGPRLDSLESALRILQTEVQELRNKGNRNSGAISIKSNLGTTTFASGPNSTVPTPDGVPQWITGIWDHNGNARMVFWDPDPLSGGFTQAEYHWDQFGQLVWTTDIYGGWAEPWFPVVLYPKFAMAPGVFQYMNTVTNVAEQTLWSADIPYISHPRLHLGGMFGAASGVNTTRYRLKLGGTTIHTWDEAGIITQSYGPFDIADRVGDKQVRIDLTAQTLSGSGNYACQIIGCHMRQS